MLVLTRRIGEKILIGPNICVTVVRLEGGQVRLGIEAPREVRVVRSELLPRATAPDEKPASQSAAVAPAVPRPAAVRSTLVRGIELRNRRD